MDIKDLEQAVKDSLTSFSQVYVRGQGELLPIDDQDLAEPYYNALLKLQQELSVLTSDTERDDICYTRYREVEITGDGIEKDSFFHYGQLLEQLGVRPVEKFVYEIVLQAVMERLEEIQVLAEEPQEKKSGISEVMGSDPENSQIAKNFLSHLGRVYNNHLGVLMHEYEKQLKIREGITDSAQGDDLTRVVFREEDTKRKEALTNLRSWQEPSFVKSLISASQSNDLLGKYPRLYYVNGRIIPDCEPLIVKDLKKFYGYNRIKSILSSYFGSFGQGQKSRPLLLQGPPGMGKTELTIAFARKHRLPMVYGSKKDLEFGLGKLLTKLGRRKDIRSVLFFDDIEAESVDWNNFRYHVSGVGYYPTNVAIVAATNDEFPDNVISRGLPMVFDSFGDRLIKTIVAEALWQRAEDKKQNRNLLVEAVAGEFSKSVKKESPEYAPRSLIAFLEDIIGDTTRMQALIEGAERTAKIADTGSQVAEELDSGSGGVEIDMSEFEDI